MPESAPRDGVRAPGGPRSAGRRSGAAVALVVASLLVGPLGCGGGDDGDGTPTGATETEQPPVTETTEAACSAAGEAVRPQDDLPPAVAAMRMRIAAAAVACDYARLERLAGEPFSYSFGERGEFAAFLRREEAQGGDPLRFLVGLLDRPFGTLDTQAGTQYVWPSAFAYERWRDVPDAEREALRPLYDESDLADFEQFGAYVGYRVGLDESGEWLFFVAGD